MTGSSTNGGDSTYAVQLQVAADTLRGCAAAALPGLPARAAAAAVAVFMNDEDAVVLAVPAVHCLAVPVLSAQVGSVLRCHYRPAGIGSCSVH
jgi:hypothetical protein